MQKLSLCTKSRPSLGQARLPEQAYLSPYQLQGWKPAIKTLRLVQVRRVPRLTLEMSQEYLNSNSLEVIGLFFQTIRSESTSVCSYLLQQASKIDLSQDFPFVLHEKIKPPLLSRSSNLQSLKITKHLLPSGLATTQNSLIFSGIASIQSVTCSNFLQYLRILLFSSCFLFLLPLPECSKCYSSMASTLFAFSVSWYEDSSSSYELPSFCIIFLVRSKISSRRSLRSRMESSLILLNS